MKRHVNAMVHDEKSYIESIGKFDKEIVDQALQDGGEGTVLRVCLGATDRVMPLRVLGYAASAQVVQARYFPNAQLQFVYPLHAAERANDLPVKDTRPETKKFDMARQNISSQGHYSVTGLIDTPPASEEDLGGSVQEVLARHPNIAQPLEAAASRRGGNVGDYVAAHLIMHDTNPQLAPLSPMNPEAKLARRIISIGAQSERIFYMARFACREAGVMPNNTTLETGQLFTKHVLPPYLHCRQGGELTLDDYYDYARPIPAFDAEHPVPSVKRDLQFLSQYLVDMTPDKLLSSEVTA